MLSFFGCSETSLAKPSQNLPTLSVQLSRHCRRLQMLELASHWPYWQCYRLDVSLAQVKLLMETNPIFGICLYAMSDSILQQMRRLNAQIFKALALSVNLIIPPVLCPNPINLDSMNWSLYRTFHIPQMCRVTCYPFRKRLRSSGEVSPSTSSRTSHISHSWHGWQLSS